jgi:hypothetical protein
MMRKAWLKKTVFLQWNIVVFPEAEVRMWRPDGGRRGSPRRKFWICPYALSRWGSVSSTFVFFKLKNPEFWEDSHHCTHEPLHHRRMNWNVTSKYGEFVSTSWIWRSDQMMLISIEHKTPSNPFLKCENNCQYPVSLRGTGVLQQQLNNPKQYL